jgi:ElaB/YqjD/DUF883 family membrane-anchored ribosome-binding protein
MAATQLTGEELKQFKKDLAELNKLRKEIGKNPIKLEANVDSVIALNDLLESTKDIVYNLDETVSGLSIQWRNITGEIKKTNEAQKLGLGSLNKLKDISDKLRLSQRGISELSSRELRSLQSKTKIEFENLKLTKEMLSIKKANNNATEEELNLLSEIEDQIENNTSAYNRQLDSIKLMEKQTRRVEKATGLTGLALKSAQGFLEKMGMSDLGGVFEEANEAAKSMAERVTEGGTKSAGLIGKIKTMGAAFKVVGREILRNLTDPLVLAGGAISLMKKAVSFVTDEYEKGKQAVERISDENTSMARSLGLAQNAANKLAGSVAGMGPSTAASKESITSIYQAMGSTEKLSTNTMKVFIKLNTYAGMSAESLVKFQKFAKLGTQDAGKMVTTMANTALQVIKTNKLAVSQKGLLDEVANVSSIVRLRFAAQPKELVKAVAATKALGLDMEKVKNIADGLLNIEDSIAAEMEAELLTGKDLNLEKARELALAGKSEEAAKLIADQMGGAAEFSKLNVVQQESLAKVLGMNRDGMADMLAAQEENKSVNGDLVAGQKDGLKAMMSGVSEAEKNANLERSRQEASMAYYQTLAPLVQKISDTFTQIKSTLNGLFNDLVVKPMTNWIKSPAGQEFLEKLPGYAKSFSEFIKDAAGKVKNVFGVVAEFVKKHPWLTAAIAGGAIGLKFLGGSMGKKADGSKNSPFFVQLAGGIGDFFSGKGGVTSKGGGIKEGVDKLGRKYKYDSATGKRVSSSTPTGGGGGGGLFGKVGNFFGGIGNKIANTGVGKFVGGAVNKASNVASKALDFANPMTYIKKYMPKLMDSKGFKKIVSSMPKIGKIASLAMIAHDLASRGMDVAAQSKAGASPQDIGKMVVMSLGDLGGSVLGGALGSLIPVPGVGTLLGTFLGGLGGSALAGLIAENTDVSGIGNWMINAFGNPKNAGKAEDFILQDGKMTKFRKDDVIIGGTNLGGSDPKIAQLLERLVNAVERGGAVYLDGSKVGKALTLSGYRM